LFTVVPAVELYLLITIGQHLGAGPTIGVVLGTGLLGAWLAKREGGRVMRQWQGAMARGEIPKEGVVSSLLVLVGGVLLVTPGVVTDVTGLLLLVPWTRRAVAHVVRGQLERRVQLQGFVADVHGFGGMGGPGGPAGPVIDVDVVKAPPGDPSAGDPSAADPSAAERDEVEHLTGVEQLAEVERRQRA